MAIPLAPTCKNDIGRDLIRTPRLFFQHLYDSHYPYYLHPDFYHHEYIHKDEEERYREALQILRAERAEQQQRQIVSRFV